MSSTQSVYRCLRRCLCKRFAQMKKRALLCPQVLTLVPERFKSLFIIIKKMSYDENETIMIRDFSTKLSSISSISTVDLVYCLHIRKKGEKIERLTMSRTDGRMDRQIRCLLQYRFITKLDVSCFKNHSVTIGKIPVRECGKNTIE